MESVGTGWSRLQETQSLSICMELGLSPGEGWLSQLAIPRAGGTTPALRVDVFCMRVHTQALSYPTG